MFGRSLFGAVEAFRSRIFQAWATGWSVPTDEIFIQVRLSQRYVEATGGIDERWLLKAARSTAVKWRDEVCRVHSGQVRSVALTGADPLQLTRVKLPRVLHVTARYCGRIQGGGFCFRHSLCDSRSVEVLHFISQVYFDPPPKLPEFPTIQFNADELFEENYQGIIEYGAINFTPKSVSSAEILADFAKTKDQSVSLPISCEN